MGPVRVFIVDDDRDFAESLAIALEGSGCEVEQAYSGEDAVRIYREKTFDITFMDIKLPGLNGVESFLEIKKFKPDVKVVMMTGYSVEELIDQAVQNGAWGILHKPLNIDNLQELINKVGNGGILIVDDDPDFVMSIKDVLTNCGNRVFVAQNGREAIQRILSNMIDILILDLRMPVLNGLETYLELKKAGHSIPTIIVTAFAEEEKNSIEMICKDSIHGVLKKPFDPRILLDAIDRISEAKREKSNEN